MTTDTWMAYANGSVFESLKSEGLNLISNKDLRQQLVNFSEAQIIGQNERNERYRDLVDEDSADILITRFDELLKGNQEIWIIENDFSNTNYTTDGQTGEMTPIDSEKLKDDQVYLYFLKSLKNRRFWQVESVNISVKKAIQSLLNNIEIKLDKVK